MKMKMKTSDIKTNEMLSFLPLRKNSVTIVLNFLIAFIVAIISLKAIDTFLFFVVLYSSKFSYT